MAPKLETSYDFYNVVSRFGEDHTRDEIIVYSRNPFLEEHKLVIRKVTAGMVMLVYDKHDVLLWERAKVTVNDAAIQFQKMWEQPPAQRSTVFAPEPVKKNSPLVFGSSQSIKQPSERTPFQRALLKLLFYFVILPILFITMLFLVYQLMQLFGRNFTAHITDLADSLSP